MAAHPWWHSAVVYQIYPRSFQDANGDGVGDLPGITERLDYLANTLGVDTVWLSPFYRSPMADFGYDVADYTDVDPIFGTLDDFDRMAARAKEFGLKLIVDFVPNHSSEEHAWFKAARSSKDDPKRDWYVWRDPASDGGPPNNWLSIFGGSAWELDEATGQYYLHSFLREQPDLNWRNPELQAAMFDALRFWMDRGVDGFRIDVAHYIMKDPAMRDNPLATEVADYHKSLGEYDSQVHLYDKGHEDVHGAFREIRQLVDTHDDAARVTIGEIHEYDRAVWVRYFGGNATPGVLDELHMPFNFALLNADWTAASIRASVDELEAALPEGAWPNYVVSNHDEKRIRSRVGAAQARIAAMLLLTLRGSPTLYYGDELGMPEVDVPEDKLQDPWGFRSLPELSRDGCRTPMAWDDSPSAGFSDAGPDDLWLPLHDDHASINVDAELDDPDSMLHLYRRLLALRKETPALQLGSYTPSDDVPDDVFAYVREHDGADGQERGRVFVALNFSPEMQEVTVPDGFTGHVLASTQREREGRTFTGTLHLGANEGVVIE
ncbi:MAG: alpha-amylase family glycosyl hydrolase [Bacteroidota bacterium]